MIDYVENINRITGVAWSDDLVMPPIPSGPARSFHEFRFGAGACLQNSGDPEDEISICDGDSYIQGAYSYQSGFAHDGSIDDSQSLAGATNTPGQPVRITTSSPHKFFTDEAMDFSGVGGMVELNSGTWRIDVISTTEFDLRDTDGQFFSTYTSGGTAIPGTLGLINVLVSEANFDFHFSNLRIWGRDSGAMFDWYFAPSTCLINYEFFFPQDTTAVKDTSIIVKLDTFAGPVTGISVDTFGQTSGCSEFGDHLANLGFILDEPCAGIFYADPV